MLDMRLNARNGNALRLLCLGSHSDDIEIGCGGTVLSLAARNTAMEVIWVVFGATERRAREASVGAEQFLSGVQNKQVIIKAFRDGFFPFQGAEIKEFFEELKGRYSPDIVLTHYRDDRHQDHRLISDLTWNTFRNHMILEYEIPKFDGDLGNPNFFVPLDESCGRKKAELILRSYPSQKEKHWFTEDTFLSLLRIRGIESCSPDRYAEAFYCRKMVMEH